MGVKLKPGQKPLHYVGIDVTNAVDTVAWGHLWEATFSWRNLLWDLDTSPGDSQQSIDKSHPLLPVRRVKATRGGNNYADRCITPHGKDGKGSDPLWSGLDADKVMTDNSQFIQSFILRPSADKSSSSLNDSGKGKTADIVYVSSHGFSDGSMNGEEAAEPIFNLGKVASSGKQFSAPGWVLLSNCSTLKNCTHQNWLKLMTNSAAPLRGITGFQRGCPLAGTSADLYAGFIRRLAKGMTLLEAYAATLRAFKLNDNWVVLCHEDAVGDTISDWNDGKLKPISISSSSAAKIKIFSEANPSGIPLIPTVQQFRYSWVKGGVVLNESNRFDLSSMLAVGEEVTIRLIPPAGTKFKDGEFVSITLIYIRADYSDPIDVDTMFDVKGVVGADVIGTTKLNSQNSGPKDSWKLKIKGDQSQLELKLKLVDLLTLHTGFGGFYLRLNVSNPAFTFDFECDTMWTRDP